MRSAAAAEEPWRLANGAALAWNAYLHLPQRQRYADALPLLLPVLQQLLQPLPAAAGAPAGAPAAAAPAGAAAGAWSHQAAGATAPAPAPGGTQQAGGRATGRRWEVAAKVAEAVAKGAEHVALLQLLRPPASFFDQSRATSAARPSTAQAAAGSGGAEAAVPPQLAFRQGVTSWYLDLQVVRKRAGGWLELC